MGSLEAFAAQIPQLEVLAEQLYNSTTVEQRAEAERMLGGLSSSTEFIPHCRVILDNSRSNYAQLLAAQTLLKLVNENTLSGTVRVDMKNYLFNYLSSNCATLPNWVLQALVQLLCRTAKLAWFDSDSAKALVEEAKGHLEKPASAAHYLLGLKILRDLVQEMNTATPGRTLTQHRKVAVSFRDLALLNVTKAALAALRYMLDNGADEKLLQEGAQLAQACLSFDFVGTLLDDSAEDVTTIQVPSSWRTMIEDPTTLSLFFDIYAASTPPLSSNALECLVKLASVRRSLFSSEAERSKFLNRLVNGTRDVLLQKQGLGEHSNYHEFCRLLGRLKTNYQLSELVAVDNYTEWIQLVASMTISSLQSWQWANQSIYYLLGLWSRLVSSMPYLKGDSPSLLEANVPKITEAYISFRLASVASVLQQNGSLDEMLESEEHLSDQLESLPYLCRFQYDKSSAYICSLMDPLVAQYEEAAAIGAFTSQQQQQLAVLEGQLAWMVYIVGSVLKGRLSSSSAESQESIDGDLASRVFKLLQLMDGGGHATRYGEATRQRLDIAVLNFFQSFRKVYIGEQVMHSSFVYSRLGERTGLGDHLAVLSQMLSKVATNLRAYGRSEQLVHLTLQLFQDLASGYMSGKLLLKLEVVSLMLQHHTSSAFHFLDHPVNGRNRTVFYSTLARLLFMEDTPHRFKVFVEPLTQVLNAIAAAAANPQTLTQQVPQQLVVGLFRDLRGIAAATSTRRTYGLLFDWLYPQHMPVVLKCLEAWSGSPEVTAPLLKFVAEFCFNKSQRLTFDSSSPNGILLFREVSKVLVTYGNHVLSPQQQQQALGSNQAYPLRYKGIGICLQALARAMSGNYVNFGVFELYGDTALRDALDVALRMVTSVPLADMMGFKKVSKAYFALLEVLCHGHTATIAATDAATFNYIFTSLEQGLKSVDVVVSSACASAADNLAAFYFRNVVQGPESGKAAPGAEAIESHLRQQPHLLPEILKALFEITLFEECSNQWSLSRPMLSLILINEAVYPDLQRQIILGQPPERQAHLAACLDKLMVDVGRNLDAKNRDKFTQNLTIVRHEYRSKA